MIEHPMAVADPHGYRATVMAVRNLAKRQVLSLEQAWSILFQGEDGPEVMPTEAEGATREALLEFGYAEHSVTPVGAAASKVLWLRPDWPAETIEEVPLT